MQLTAPLLLALVWLSGCTPVVRCVVEPSVEQYRWMTDVTERSNEHELRLLKLERDAAERERGI